MKFFLKTILYINFFLIISFNFSFSQITPNNPNQQPGPWNPNFNPPDWSNPIPPVQLENNNKTQLSDNYKLLVELPGLEDFDSEDECAFGNYLNTVINLVLGVLVVLAVLMIVIGGMQYMGSEILSQKQAGMERVKNALLGLVIALSAFIILRTINPDLLNLCLDVPEVEAIILEGDANAIAFSPLEQTDINNKDIYCPGSGGASALTQIAQSFIGKVTYSQEKRQTSNSSTIFLDCSSFVKQVYNCAGLNFPGDRTATMFSNSTKITTISGTTVNGIPLKPGDILGWKQGESSSYPGQGHVVMYIGGGKMIEVSSSGGTNGAVKIRNLSTYGGSYNHIIRP